MLLVILGAGASAGCVRISGSTMPVTSDLFNPHLREVAAANAAFPAAVPIAARVRRAQLAAAKKKRTIDVEAELQMIADRGRGQPEIRDQLVAMRFWLRDRIRDSQHSVLAGQGGVTRYHDLVNDLGDWAAANQTRVIFVTFNYDTLLDAALTAYSPEMYERLNEQPIRVPKVDQYWGLFRPHGSIEWNERWTLDQLPGSGTKTAGYLRDLVDGDPEFDLGELGQWRIGGRVETFHIPAIAVPLLTKSRFAWPRMHGEALEQLLPQVTHAVTIGWRGREQHFAKTLQLISHEVPIVFTGRNENSAHEIATTAAAQIGREKAAYAVGTMESFTDQNGVLPLPGSSWFEAKRLGSVWSDGNRVAH